MLLISGLSEGLPEHFLRKLVSFEVYNPDIVLLPLIDQYLPDYTTLDALAARGVRVLFI